MNIESPSSIPADVYNCGNYFRNLLCALDSFRSVDIQWEQDVAASNREGESVGDWHIEIIGAGRTGARVTHHNLLEALWSAYEQATAHNSEYWEKRDAERKSALSKLTDSERSILGL